MRLSIRSSLALWLFSVLALVGTYASAQAPGVYQGQTTQGDAITINVAHNEITSWKSSYTCGGAHFAVDSIVQAGSCPILSAGNFQCGDIVPSCGTTSLQGDVVGPNMLLGTLAAYTPSCNCFQDVVYSANLTAAPGGSCVGSGTNLCLGSSRFKVEATWQSATASGTAQAVPLTNDTGYLWFFTADSIEAVVKLVDGCTLNQHFWVFAAGLTNVHVVLKITDTKTNAVKTYNNKLGTLFAPIADTSAFACP
jgi:hypothetical protein